MNSSLKVDNSAKLVRATDDAPAISWISSPNTTHGRRGAIKPTLVVLHWTGGVYPGPAVNTFANSRSKVSAHIVIDRLGNITQMLPLDRKAWHAGKSKWKGKRSVNGFSIGIELVNAGGPLKPSTEAGTWTNGRYAFQSNETTFFDGKAYHKYSDRQLSSLDAVLVAITDKYSISEFVGHQDVAPRRKRDPGPLLGMKELYTRITSETTDKPGETSIALEQGLFGRFSRWLRLFINKSPLG